MDILNQAIGQLRDLFRSLSPGARLTAGLLLAAVVVSTGYLFTYQVAAGDVYLLGGQSFAAAEVSAMEAAFGQAGLSGYAVEGSRVRIPRGQQAQYLAALADAGALPRHFHDIGAEAINGVGPFTSRQQQEEMIKLAKQRELSLVIRSMRGIEDAAVHYDMQKKPGFRQPTVATASVSVKPAGGRALDEAQVPMIRDLVAGAIAGLDPASVTVVDLNGRTYSGGKSDGVGSALDDPYLARMKTYQAEYETMVANALSYVPGVAVTAHVELDRELRLVTEKVEINPKPVVLSSTEETNSVTSEMQPAGGRPGFEAQRPNQGQSLGVASRGNTNQEERSSTQTQSVASTDRTTTEMAPLTPRRVTVSVAVPSDYFEKVWREQNPAPAGSEPQPPQPADLARVAQEETTKIRAHVAALIPKPTDPALDPTSLVTVSTFSRVTPTEAPGIDLVTRLVSLAESYGATLGLLALVLVSLLMLRSLVKSLPAAAPASTLAAAGVPAAAPSPAATATPGRATAPTSPASPATAEKPARTLKRKLGTGASLRDELAEMVREDPNAAAAILRNWIGNAS